MIEPISLYELKEHLKLNRIDDIDVFESIAYASHVVTTDYTILGSYTDVLGFYSIQCELTSGTNGTGGTVDVKIQESDDRITWTDYTDGAFTQITETNDNAVYVKGYSGFKQFIRVVAKVLVAACTFGVNIKKTYSNPSSSADVSETLTITQINEDVLLSSLIATARDQAEAITKRQFITATKYLYLNAFPKENYIKLPWGQLQSVTSVVYKDSDGTDHTMVEGTDYLVDTSGIEVGKYSDSGRIVLPYAVSWPSFTAYSVNPITITYVCGYGIAADVPAKIKMAIKMIASDMYMSRGESILGQTVIESKTAENLLYPYRLWSF